MSWQTYVDDHLMCDIDGSGGHLSHAAIIGQDGSVWAQSPAFPQFKPEEITGIMNDFNEPGTLAPTGLYLGGTKYMVIQGEAGAVIRGKKSLPFGWSNGSFVGNLSGMRTAISTVHGSYQLQCCTWNGDVHGYQTGSGGITIKKTSQAMILGIYEETVTPGQCNMIVERLGDYLIDQGL